MDTSTRCDTPASARPVVALLAVAVLTLGWASALAPDLPFPPLRDLARWLDAGRGADVALVTLRLGVQLVAAYLLVVALLRLLARAPAVPPRARRIADRLTLPALRRLLDRGVAVGAIAGTTLTASLSPAVAAATVPGPPGVVVPAAPAPAAPLPAPTARVRSPLPTTTEPPAGPRPDGETHHVVRPGEHLWSIAAADLAARRGDDGPPEVERVAARWRAVVAANAGRLRSGDPDLIHPGETVILPGTPAT